MNKNIKVVFIIFSIIILVFFVKTVNKKIKCGNNIIKSNKDLIEYILNISSYEAKAEIIVKSNKTSNKYTIEQYFLEPSYSKQIVKQPNNIENLEIIYNGKNLEVKNTNIGLNKIYEQYTYLNENILWLNYFISNCNNCGYEIETDGEEIILKSNIKDKKYKGYLYINKNKKVPTKLKILDNSNKEKVYIEYKEIKLNNIQENNIF